MGSEAETKLKYLLFYGIGFFAAFQTYQAFIQFRGSAILNTWVMLLNTSVLLILWFFCITSHSDFVRGNMAAIIVVPLSAVYLTDSFILLSIPETDPIGLAKFVFFSGLLMFSSYKSAGYEKQYQDKDGPSEDYLKMI